LPATAITKKRCKEECAVLKKRFVTDLEECQRLWKKFIPVKSLSDLWDFRFCFQRHFNHRPFFLVLEDEEGIAGILPLSYLAQADTFVFFPGETWKERTWIERTPIYAREHEIVQELFHRCPERTYLRYMDVSQGCGFPDLDLDEIGYVLYPSSLDFDLGKYEKRFSHKKIKEIRKAITSLSAKGNLFNSNRLDDFEVLVEMNLERFGASSYFHDERFKDGFRDVMFFLYRKGCLRLFSLEINGKTAAVDLGALYLGTYTVYLGGTDRDYPGVAKVMNMHHLEFACKHRIHKVDFLCGDFHWKKLWHLDPEPLHKFVSPALSAEDRSEENSKGGFVFLSGPGEKLDLSGQGSGLHAR